MTLYLTEEDVGALLTTEDALAAVEETQVDVANLEAAVLDRTRGRRKFHRLTDQELDGMVSSRR